MARYKLITNHWFVSVETPEQLRLFSSARRPRETKSFSTEIEARQFARCCQKDERSLQVP
jgi:hypothetical protein